MLQGIRPLTTHPFRDGGGAFTRTRMIFPINTKGTFGGLVRGIAESTPRAANCFFFHTPGQLPPHDPGHGVKTVTLGWVGAPNELTPFRIHGAVIGFVDQCLSRTRNLAASTQTSA